MNNLTPQIAARNLCSNTINQGFMIEALHEYQDTKGQPIFWRIRLKNSNTGKKLILPMYKNEKEKYELKEPPFTNKKPIYHLFNISSHPDQPVYIVEGEKCAEQLTKFGLIATTSGSWSSSKHADWSILKDRKIFIWRDFDSNGLQYAKDVTEALQKLHCEVLWIDVEKLNLLEKGDCIDWIKNKKEISIDDFESLPLIKPFSDKNTTKINQSSFTNSDIDTGDKKSDSSKTTLLLKLVKDVEFFHDEQKQSYATFRNNDHFESWPIESSKFKSWLAHQFWKNYNNTANDAALKDAICTMKGQAVFEGSCQQVFMRVGYLGDKIYINLANEKWQVIEISNAGWKILDAPPVKFCGTQHMQPLPVPASNGDINLLWKHLNIPATSQILVIAWMLECLRPNTPFLVLVLMGLQGSGKSRTQEILRKIIDPSRPNLRSAPKKSDDVFIAAANNWLVSYNNVSKLSTENRIR